MKQICVIGGGRWGQNHIKTLYQMKALGAIVENRTERLKELLTSYPGVQGWNSLDRAVAHGYDGYVVATPAETHFQVAEPLLAKGNNVLVEKPMTLSAQESQKLIETAARYGGRLMVGHLLLFHPAIRKIKEVLDGGKIGKLHYIYSTRLNLGTVRTEENVFWSFAPHDISVLDYLIGKPAVSIQAKGSKFLQNQIYDVTLTQFEYPDNVHAHIFVSWLHPFKEQRLVLVGSDGMLSFDDSSALKEIHFYNKHIDFVEGKPIKVELPDEIIAYEKRQPLEEELRYFMDHFDKPVEVAGGQSGYEVVKVLEKVQKLIEKAS